MKHALQRHWFLASLLIVLVGGVVFADALAAWPERFPKRALVGLVLFFMSFTIDAGVLVRALRRPHAAALAIGVNAVLLPLLAWGATTLFPSQFTNGVLIAAALPCTLASAAVWTRRGGGNEAVALICTMVTNFACFAITPFWLRVTTGQGVEAPAMMEDLFFTAVLPMAAGQAARLWSVGATIATRYKHQIGVFDQCGILAMVLLGAIQSAPAIRPADGAAGLGWEDWAGMASLTAGIHTAALLLGFGLGKWTGLARPDWIAVGIAGSQKTLMIGLQIATVYESVFGPLAVLPLVTFHCLQLLIDTLVADRLARPPRPLPPAEEEAEDLAAGT